MMTEQSTTDAAASRTDSTVADRHHDWSGDHSVTVTIVEALEEAGVDTFAEDLCLCDAVDPDGLDRLFQPTERRRARGFVRFRFGGHEVTVHADGRVTLTPVPDAAGEREAGRDDGVE